MWQCSYTKLNIFRSLVPAMPDQREVRCKSVATVITVIEDCFISRNTHQAYAKASATSVAAAFLDMKSVAVFLFFVGEESAFSR